MRFMMLMIPRVYQPGTPPGQRAGEGFTPPLDAVEKMNRYNQELAEAGALVALDGLHPSSRGARIAFGGSRPKVNRGPYWESGEVVGGYWIIQAGSIEEAIDWARRCPAAEGDVIEVRQVFEMSEFPPELQRAAENSAVTARLRNPKR